MKLILFILMTYLVYRFLSRFFTNPAERRSTGPQWKTFYTNVPPNYGQQPPKEKDVSGQGRVIDSNSLGEK
ncbi:hypothetical protein LFX25_06975 [Leptospira sp. FAT2]|uniref:hypothetical protein n=1 Tax=Leptospira sanjuanensis TaxID=2879643 RepID=UPI001EE8CAF5|nr:hypothetical protein [Leptospira sanjuanensis]MCG6167563.1 hypothetical protein [Leptospira sanjuanensis]MCG6192982.1 hypothetical protein [Leptospira sanjuanensis]